MSYSQEIRYIELCLGEDEIQQRVADLGEDARRQSMVRWEGGTMTIKQLQAWGVFAAAIGGVAADSYNIYRLRTAEELRKAVLEAEHYRRRYTTKDMPEDLEDPEAAAADYTAERSHLALESDVMPG